MSITSGQHQRPGGPPEGGDGDDADLEALRNAFVEAFNARDLETILELVADDVETPDIPGRGIRRPARRAGGATEDDGEPAPP